MSKQLANLCTILIRHVYGELPSEIFAILLESDRLPLPEICVLLKLSVNFVKHGLAILAQQNLILYHPIDASTPTFYQANLAQAYAIARHGKNIKIAQDRLGPDGAKVLSAAQALGCATRKELATFHDFEAMPANAEEEDLFKQAKIDGRRNTNGLKVKKANGATHGLADGTISEESQGPPNGLKRARSSESDVADESDDDNAVVSTQHLVTQMIDLGYLEKLEAYTFLPPTDFDLIVQDHVRKTDKTFRDSITGPKKSIQFRDAVDDHKRTILEGLASLPKREDEDSEEDSDQPPSKKRRVGEAMVASLETSTHYRLNVEKVLIAMRTEILTRFVHRRVGESFSKVYGAFLRQLEDETEVSGEPYKLTPQKKPKYGTGQNSLTNTHYKDEEEDVEEEEDIAELAQGSLGSASTSLIAARMDEESIKLMNRDLDYIFPGERQQSVEAIDNRLAKGSKAVNGEAKRAHVARQERESLQTSVGRALRVIADSSIKFLNEVGEEDSNEWTVDLGQLVRSVVQEELENVIEARFGPTGKRLARILQVKGKLDERQLSAIALIRQRDLRAILTQMQNARYLDVQEVPRDNSRQPNRTVYLWFFDQDRCRDAVVEDIYKAMTRLLERYEHEQDQVRSVLAKASRTDVQGNEEKYLSDAERQALDTWHRKEHKIFLALARNDELILVFRDLLTPPLLPSPTS